MAMGDNSKMALGRGAPVALAVAAATAAALISGCAGAHQLGTGSSGGPSSASVSSGSASPGSASSGSAASGSAAGSASPGGAVGATAAAATGGATAGTPGGTPGGGGAAAPAQASACATPGSYLTAIRTGRQASADRVVFQFAGELPSSYTVTPVPQVVGDASGKPVAITGKSFLRVTFRGATAVCPDTGHTTYPGPSAATPNYAQLLGLAAAGDFEGYLTWGIGLAVKGGYHAYTLTAPYRVVIDISRP
jgi:hypothetical protein